MQVYPDRMRRNLEATRGLVSSGQLLLDLAAAGMLREQAYRIVQNHAMDAWQNDRNFRDLVRSDPEISQRLTADQIDAAFSLNRYTKHISQIFDRVFSNS